MKKLTRVLGCWLLFSLVSSYAMADEGGTAAKVEPVPRLGVEGGFTFGNLTGPGVNDVFGSRFGIVGGIYLNLPLTGSILGFQPEFLYEQRGGKFDGNLYQLDYLAVPLLMDINFGMPVFNPDILLGPCLDDVVATEGVPDANHFEVGLMLGAQVNFSGFFISGRYELGLTNVSGVQNIQTDTWLLMAGLSYI
ncbi:MAG TPA: porin family protein [bacterium]|jgi:hypothetical protein|nr:porin family protein [bacterium]